MILCSYKKTLFLIFKHYMNRLLYPTPIIISEYTVQNEMNKLIPFDKGKTNKVTFCCYKNV